MKATREEVLRFYRAACKAAQRSPEDHGSMSWFARSTGISPQQLSNAVSETRKKPRPLGIGLLAKMLTYWHVATDYPRLAMTITARGIAFMRDEEATDDQG